MNVLKLFRQKSKSFYLFLVLLGIANSSLNSAVLIFINSIVAKASLPFAPGYRWLVFAGIVLGSLLCNRVFQTYMVRLSNDILTDYELTILNQLRLASYESFEKLSSQKVYSVMSDIRVMSQLPENFITMLNAFVIVVCSLAYLFWLSPYGGASVLVVMLGLLIVYLVRNQQVERDMNRVRDLQNDYFKYLRDLLYGHKEIKMSSVRNENIFNRYIRPNRMTTKALNVSTSTRYINNELIGSFSWYVLLGMAMFGLPALFTLNTGQVATFIISILYLMGPVATLILFVPFHTRTKIALNRITELQEQIAAAGSSRLPPAAPQQAFRSIRFSAVTYEYFDAQRQEQFVLGPIDLNIAQGELIFVTGGNGSGKSTFINLLVGLYKPHTGTILFNGAAVTADRLSFYSDHFAAIFTNNYLFEENYDGFALNPGNKRLTALLETMQMNEVVQLGEHTNRIDNRLSKGQQKRLAMIYALLEDRPVLVLDEWAAEQDPAFRAYFYRVFLPGLRRAGKTIVAVTHDDEYYGCADRIIKFNYGKIVSDDLNPSLKNALSR